MNDFATVPDAPQSDSMALLNALAADLTALKYTVDGVSALLGPEASDALGRDQIVPALLVLQFGTNPLATVVRLWLLAEDVTADALTAALPGVSLAQLITLGLIVTVPDPASLSSAANIRAVVDLRPYGWPGETSELAGTDLWVASDLGAHQRPGVLRRDHVLGIGQASLTLAQCTIRRVVGRALDLGTGCGIQLFHLLHHASTVVATDISVRALAFTRFNLLLNSAALGLSETDLDAGNSDARVSLRLGSLLAPVAGEKFDLVVSNPPFVITPRHLGEQSADQFTYRDGGLAGDAIVETLVRELPSVLAPGGIAQMLGNWEVVEKENSAGEKDAVWHTRPMQWCPDDAQAWFIQREQVSPPAYAETWLQDASQGRQQNDYLRAYTDYMHDFASRQVIAIGFGYILLRRAERRGAVPPDSRFEEILYPIEQPIGSYLAAALDREQWLSAHESLWLERLVVAEDVTEERHQKPGAEHPGVILLRQGAGLRRTNLMSTELAGFVSASDGELSAGQLITALAALLERDDAAFAQALEAEVRNLVRDGFLLPVDPVDPADPSYTSGPVS